MPKTAPGTDAGFEAFYERHWKYVYRLCYIYMKRTHDAEDCAEDVFVKVLVGDFSFEDESHERKWLAVTAINHCKDRLKSRERRAVVHIDDGRDIPAPEPDDNSDVFDAVMKLAPKYKDIVWLHYYEGYRTDEIAEMLGRSPSTVRNQIRDARIRLKKVLKGDI